MAHQLQHGGVSAEPVNSAADVLKNAQLNARSNFIRMDRRIMGQQRYVGVTARLCETPGIVHHPAPTLGEHNGFILGELLGLNGDEVVDLEVDGVIGDRVEIV